MRHLSMKDFALAIAGFLLLAPMSLLFAQCAAEGCPAGYYHAWSGGRDLGCQPCPGGGGGGYNAAGQGAAVMGMVGGFMNVINAINAPAPQPQVNPAEVQRRAAEAEAERQRRAQEAAEAEARRQAAEARKRAEEDARARKLQGEMMGLDGDGAGDGMQFMSLDDTPGAARPAGKDLGLMGGSGSGCEAAWNSCASAMEANDLAMQSDYEVAADARNAIAKGQLDATIDDIGDAMKERGKGLLEPLKPEEGGGVLQAVGLSKEKADKLVDKGVDAAAEKGADASGKRLRLPEEKESEKTQGDWMERWNKFIAESVECMKDPDQESCEKRALDALGKAKDKLKDYAGAAGQRANAAEEAINKIVNRSLNRSIAAMTRTAQCAASCR